MGRILHSLVRLRALFAKEFLLLLRDPRMRFFVIVPPLIQLVVFGYAATFDVRYAEIGAVDQAMTAETRALLSAVAAGGHYRIQYFADMAQAGAAVDHGDIRAVVRFAPDFERDRTIQLIGDGSDSNSAQMILGQLKQSLRDSLDQGNGAASLLELEDRAWFNPNLDDRDYFVPGIMANVVLIATMILMAMSVVREREHGTLEQLLVTPLARVEFLLGKIIPVACIGLFDVLVISLIAVLWFDVPFRGEALALLVGSGLYLMSALGLGLLISSYASTQQQAVLLAFFLIMPLVILSGFAFPIRNMPEGVQVLTWVDPLRYYLVVVRDIFLKGAGLGDHGFEYAMMALLGVSAMGLSLLRIR